MHLSRRLKCTIVITRCPSVRPSLLTFHIFDFFSETAERNSTKLDRQEDLNVLYQVCVLRGDRKKQDGHPGLWLTETLSTSPLRPLNGIQGNLTGSNLNVIYQNCVFRADRKNKMAASASDWLRHFQLLVWNRWKEFNETWQEARCQCPLPSLCFSDWLENKVAAPPFDWLRHFQLLLWNRWTDFNETRQEAKSLCPLPSLCFFAPIGDTRWPPRPLIGQDIFDFSFKTAAQNSTKLDRKQDLNVFYH